MALPDSFFSFDGTHFHPTELTRGPWDNRHQHGGPPSALLARAAEQYGSDAAGFFLARLTVEYLRPVPLAPLSVSVRPLKLGAKVQRLEVALTTGGGEELARARVVRIRRGSLPALPSLRPPPPTPAPEALPTFHIPFFRSEVAYHRAVEGRYARGRFGESSVTVWMRPLVPLVAGEPTSPVVRSAVLVDAQSGVCTPVDVHRFTFVNPDLTLYLDREPVGEWVALEAISTASPLGVGLAQSALYDVEGQVGRSAQSLVVEQR